MKHLYYVLTSRCNQICDICPRAGTKRQRDADIEAGIERLAKVIDENSVTDITVSGGEPSLFKGFRNVIDLLDEKNIRTVILSNSMKFSDKKYAEDSFGCIRHPENFRLVSAVHSLDNERHDKVTGIKNSLSRTAEGLRNVLGIGITVEVKCIIGPHNFTELPNYPQWVNRNVSPDANLIFCSIDYAGMTKEQIGRYRIDFKSIRPYLEQAFDNSEKWLKAGNTAGAEIPLCGIDPYYWNMLIPAPATNSIYDDSHWEKETQSVSDIGPKAKKCDQCIVKGMCHGIWRTQYLEYGEDAVQPYKQSV